MLLRVNTAQVKQQGTHGAWVIYRHTRRGLARKHPFFMLSGASNLKIAHQQENAARVVWASISHRTVEQDGCLFLGSGY